MTYDLTTIGEGQIRLTVNKGERLLSANSLRMTAACSEANVSGLLAQLGHPVSWASKMPAGDLAERVLSEFRSVGVDLSNMVRAPEGRVALYFMEPGEFPMPGKVTYDRMHTAFRTASIDDFNWDSLFDTRVVFVTGITAALTDDTARLIRYFVDGAAERGIDIVLDVNYRSMLWDPDDACRILAPIAHKASVLFCSRRDAATVFGIDGDGPTSCRKMREHFGVPQVVATDQCNGVYYSSASTGELTFDVERVPVIDRPGAGDAFVAGTLHGFLTSTVLDGIQYGLRTAKFALTHHGDLTHISPAELAIPVTTDIVR
ncbi:2-keto-3-deoxygluconate kinase [Bowdeniella nasicola]|uniref:2-keto-3-deoxygluconate kinase n=1 Tax=Bowdeniella nasicola TaxID=208480 RepID=A0A1Q5Q1R6_9ACTO|nr:sugar kinase [Bowdeniella nasicola]OKL53813.1 2-keto-3-deoxygluconate kinase [Bowdeniella nasicola]